MTRVGLVLASVAALVSCAHATPPPGDDDAAEQARYQAGERFCKRGDRDICLELATSDLRSYRLPGPHQGDLALLRRARERLVGLCGDAGATEACMRLEPQQTVWSCATSWLGEACMTIYREYATIFEGRPGPAPREIYARRACSQEIEEGCPLVATPPTSH